MNTKSAVRALLVVTTVASAAFAEDPAPVTATPGSELYVPPRPRPGARLHDGFYLRVGSGFGSYQERIFHKMGTDEAHTTVTGMGTASELMIGGNISRRLVLGGGSWGTTVLASDVTVTKSDRGTSPNASDLSGTPSLTLFGPFLSYYCDPTGGLAFYGGLGFASAREVDPAGAKFDRDRVAIGGGGVLGIGYDWWVGDEWSIGVSGRAMSAIATRKIDGERLWHMVVASPAVLFTVTYH